MGSPAFMNHIYLLCVSHRKVIYTLCCPILLRTQQHINQVPVRRMDSRQMPKGRKWLIKSRNTYRGGGGNICTGLLETSCGFLTESVSSARCTRGQNGRRTWLRSGCCTAGMGLPVVLDLRSCVTCAPGIKLSRSALRTLCRPCNTPPTTPGQTPECPHCGRACAHSMCVSG